jgi:uridylate kinase
MVFRNGGVSMRVTISLGGSVVAPGILGTGTIKKVAKVIKELKAEGNEVLVVVGGGKPAREYIKAAQELKASDSYCDEIGIEFTRLNARLLISALGNVASSKPLMTIGEAISEMFKDKIPVMGGTVPGHTTDTVAAMLADSSKSELLVFLTDVGGVYTDDPKLHPNTKKLDRISTEELLKIASKAKMKPGMCGVVDPLAASIIHRSKLKSIVLGSREMNKLPEILKGAKHGGTTISPEK